VRSREAPSRNFNKIPVYPRIFPELAINEPENTYEREANRVADQAMNLPFPEFPPLRLRWERQKYAAQVRVL
jgi:hypothetical protein